MFLRQVFDPHLAQFAYVIGCQKTGEAIVIDPLRDVDQYRAIAAAEGLTLSAVAETHIHADFVSGARELAADPSVRVYLSAEGGPDWQSEWAADRSNVTLLRDGTVFRIGNIKFEVMHTPGHTPEHLCYLVTDEGGGANEPVALISGDFLFVGDVGRPDLLEQAAGQTGTQEAGARQLYHSLKKLAPMADYIQVLPAHGAGSSCGKSLGAVPVSTIGYEKRFNRALRLALEGTEADFVSFILEGQPEPPLYFGNMKVVNKVGPAVLGTVPVPAEMDLGEITSRLPETDFVVLDTRSDRQAFASSHLRGSLYAPARGDFSGFAGSYLQPDDQVVLLVDSADEVESLTRQLLRMGFDHLPGWVPAEKLQEAENAALAGVETLNFSDVEDRLQADPATLILDVRRAGEYAAAHLKGAVNIAHTRLRARTGELPGDGPILVHCQGGMRASSAVAWLQRAGRRVLFVNDSFSHAPGELLA